MISEASALSRPQSITQSLQRWLGLAVWVAASLFHLTLLTLDLIRDYPRIMTPCTGDVGLFGTCGEQLAITAAEIAVLEAWGFSLQDYAVYMLSFVVVGQIIYVGMSLFFLRNQGLTPFGFLVAYLLISIPSAYYASDEFISIHPNLGLSVTLFISCGNFVQIAFLYLVPNGRFYPRWATIPFVSTLVFLIFLTLATKGVALPDWLVSTTNRAIVALIPIGIGFQGYRYLKISDKIERQQTKWIILGVAALACSVLLWALTIGGGLPIPNGRPLLLSNTIGWAVQFFAQYLFGVFLMIAILRYRLWNIDIIINRTLVYGGLTLLVVAVYTLVVGGLGLLFQSAGNLGISLMATALVALLFQPVRDWLQGSINRLMFGERNNPYAVLSMLGQQLQTTAVPSETLNSLVQTLADTLKLPYVAIELVEEGQRIKQAIVGNSLGESLELPLRYQQETVGYLIVSQRSPGEPFTRQEKQLFESIAAQIGPVASATRLTTALQHARERLVLTREEERRRIRRDLHDGLGPTMASQTLRLEAVLDMLLDNPQLAFAQVEQLKAQTQAMVADIRRLVYELYPSALDELGLVAALQAHIGQVHGLNGRLVIAVQASDAPLPRLPAAIEVAAYRIALEAVTNAVRHARASRCDVLLTTADGILQLTISDDGAGLPASYKPGIGLASMAERAEELGGSFEVGVAAAGGVMITASLPYDRR